jgi:hypothetical protein
METYWKGNKAKYTGNSEVIHNGLFYELELLEGHLKGQKKWTQKQPSEPIDPYMDYTKAYYLSQHEIDLIKFALDFVPEPLTEEAKHLANTIQSK